MTISHDLAGLVGKLKGKRIICLGDVMLDRYVYGSVDRISPEAPIPVIAVKRQSAMPGGVGNVARNVAALGGEAILIGVAGNDDAGKELKRLIADDERMIADLVYDKDRPTTVKTRFMAGGHHLLRADEGEGATDIDEGVEYQVLRIFESELADADAVILSDYAKGVLTPRIIAEAIKQTRAAGKPVVVDPKSRDFRRYAGASFLTPNAREVAQATGITCVDDEMAATAGSMAREDANAAAVLVTRSEQGMTLVDGEGAQHFRARALEVFDVSGAGDTVIAALTLALTAGASNGQAVALANAAAGVVVGKVGTAVIHPDELANALHSEELGSAEAKIRELPQLMERIERWRSQGFKVGFTNGCFDLIHPGHISLLSQSKAQCDRLIVGLNSDASVKRLKGETRPVQSEMARAIVLASLADVDAVILFDEDTPLGLIQVTKPDVLIKGADYTVETVVGSDVVQANGGRVYLADLKDGFSTTRTIEKLNK